MDEKLVATLKAVLRCIDLLHACEVETRRRLAALADKQEQFELAVAGTFEVIVDEVCQGREVSNGQG